MPRRVLHLIDTGGPGGAETVFLELASGLDSARWDSVAVIPCVDWLHEALVARGIQPILLGGRGSFDVPFLVDLIRTTRRLGVDLIQTHLLGSAVYGGLAARALRLPVVSTFHGQVDVGEDESFRRTKMRIVDRPRSRVVFVSDALRRHFQSTAARYVAEGITRVVHNGLDLEEFRPARDETVRASLGYGPEDIVIGAVGNVRPAKAYEVLLRAAAIVHAKRPETRFLIAGEGDDDALSALGDLRSELGLEPAVRFTGFLDDIAAVFSALDVFVLSSTFEGFSLSTLQAVASGVPAVATRCGGPEEILEEGVSGVFAEPNSPESLAAALDTVLDGALTDGVPPRSATRCRLASIDHFTTAAMVASYDRLYEELLDGPGEAGHGAGTRTPPS